MNKFKITEWNHSGFEQILCSDGAKRECEKVAEKIKDNADSGLTSENTSGFAMGGKIVEAYGSNRWMYFVHTIDAATSTAEQQDQVLSKAVN